MSNRKAALLTIIVVATISWAVSIIRMKGMDMGIATDLGSFGSFMTTWIIMTSAMMLPGATSAVLRFANSSDSVFKIFLFIGTYLIMWSLLGFAIYIFYRPHGSFYAGVIVIVAGIYELIPQKKIFRKCCFQNIRSGFRFGLYCIGSCIGLMLIQVGLGLMSLKWMLVIAVLALIQKLLPVRDSIDTPIALIIVGFGMLIIITPPAIWEPPHPKWLFIECSPQCKVFNYQYSPPASPEYNPPNTSGFVKTNVLYHRSPDSIKRVLFWPVVGT